MLILLPPSETKTRPDTGPTLNLSALTLPELTAARTEMIAACGRTARLPEGVTMLKVPASAPELTERMQQIEQEPCALPLEVYSGVLYEALGEVSPAQGRRVLVQSALLGLVDAARDAIPAYRVSAGSTLDGLGKAGTWWARHLKEVGAALMQETAESGSPLVIDCRSGAYRSMMKLRSTEQVRVLEVGAVQEIDGVRTVVSHDAKRYRGWVTRVLNDAPQPAATPEEVLAQLKEGFSGTLDVELDGDTLVVVDRPRQEHSATS